MISDMDIQSLSDREMKMIVTVSKWGNSLGIRVPSDITAATGIRRRQGRDYEPERWKHHHTEEKERCGTAESFRGAAPICES